MVTALTIAGSDSSGGAGIQADLKTFCSYGIYGAAVITALTAQNTIGVQEILKVKESFVAKQLDAVLSDLKVDAVKIGMLYAKGIVKIVAQKLIEYRVKNIVLDPVMFSKSGDALIEEDARIVIKEKLIPICDVITPNIFEAESLTGFSIKTIEEMKKASERLYLLGCKNAIIKGGHLQGEAIDILYDGKGFKIIEGERISKKNPHGTGCTFSSAITAGLALGYNINDAFEKAKKYVVCAIKNSFSLGKGFDLLNHTYKFYDVN